MGMFDAESKRLMTADEMAGAGADLLSNQLAPGIKRMTGYESPKRQAMAIAEKADLSSMQSIQGTYKQLQGINPAAASAWLKDVTPVINQYIEQQKATQSGRDSRGPMQKAVEFAAKVRGCKPGDNACLKESVLDAKEFKRASESDKEETKLHADLSKEVYSLGSAAHEDIARYDQMLTILPDIYTGWGGEAIAYPVAQISNFLGLDKESAGKMEVFRSGAMSQALTYIAQTKGAVSDREFTAFREAASGLSRSELGNKLLLRTAKEYAKFRKAKAAELAAWTTKERAARRVPTAAGWKMHFSDWAHKKENIIHLPTQAEMDQAMGMSTGPSSSSLEDLKKRHQALKGK